MSKSIFSAAVMLIFANPTAAFELADIERCTVIEADSARLACFDAVTADLSASKVEEDVSEPSPVASTDTGAWEINVEVDPITDDKVVTAAIEDVASASSFSKPVLLIRCKAKSAELFIAWNEYLADELVVTTRIDEADPQISRWEPSTDQTATFASNPSALLSSLRGAERFSARITPYRSGTVTASFPVTGLDTILTTHEDACGKIERAITAPAP